MRMENIRYAIYEGFGGANTKGMAIPQSACSAGKQRRSATSSTICPTPSGTTARQAMGEDRQRPSKTVKDRQSFCGRCRVGRAGRGQKIEDEDEHEDESRLIKGKAPSSNSQRNFKHQPPMQELKNLPDAQVAGHALRIGTIRAPGQNRGRGRGRGGLKANQG